MRRKPPEAFETLVKLSRTIHTYESISSLLHWDQETMMPEGGILVRSKQQAELAELIHKQKTSTRFQKALGKLIYIPSGKPKIQSLSKEELACCREWLFDLERMQKLPASFIKAFSQTTSESCQVWAEAKRTNQFTLFAPFLEKIVALSQEKAALLGYEDHPYDALLACYEPCMSSRRLNQIFDRLKTKLKKCIKQTQENQKEEDLSFLHKRVSDAKQLKIAQELLKHLPIEPEFSRLDLSSHPFSIAMHPHDSRITTRILPNAFLSNIFSVLHEVGHSLYEMGLPPEHWGTPLGEAVSLSIHESQSRFWETLIGRSFAFWERFYPVLQKELSFLKPISLETFYRALHKVTPSFIRVEADEMTYCLHIILRYEIERELIEGTLPVSDLPSRWREKMEEFFDITPPTDTEGCLQDIHWSLGDFGYFPTYALGNLFAAQFFSSFQKEQPNWESKMVEGDLSFIRQYLRENIHRGGRTYNADMLVKKVTKKPLSEEAFCAYLKKKYEKINA